MVLLEGISISVGGHAQQVKNICRKKISPVQKEATTNVEKCKKKMKKVESFIDRD